MTCWDPSHTLYCNRETIRSSWSSSSSTTRTSSHRNQNETPTRAARPGTSLSHKHRLLFCCPLPLPHILTTFPFYASPRPRQWHHLSSGSYSTGRCASTLDKARHDHSYVRRDPRGSRRLSHPPSPPIRVWGLSCTPPPTHRTLFYTFVSTHAPCTPAS